MGGMGTSTSTQDTNQRQTQNTNATQQSQTAPWLESQPAVQGILSQIMTGLNNTGLNGAETGAINTLNANARTANQFAPPIGANARELLAGGGATNQTGAINQNYQRYVDATKGLAGNTNYDPYSTPGFADAVNTLKGDITNSVNGSFAGAGRDFSGANFNALGRGITQGIAPSIVSQYNANVNNQQGAASNLYNAGNTNAGLLSGLQQRALANKQLGTQAATDALNAQNQGANDTLKAEAARRGISPQALGLLANIGIPIAGLGSQNSGTVNSTGTGTSVGHSDGSKTASPLEMFGQLGSGLTGMFGGIPGMSTAQSLFKMISDRRAKEDIAQVGTLFDGTPVYRYRYIGQPAFQIGLMAQDIEKVTPEAVGMIGPFKAIDYKLATDKALEAA